MKRVHRIWVATVVGMLGIQMLSITAASASNRDDCDFGRNSLEVKLGGPRDGVGMWISGSQLWCSPSGSAPDSASLASIRSITVEMDDEEDGAASLTIYLNEDDGSGDVSVWPKFDTFDIDVTTTVILDGSAVDADAGNNLRITVGAKTLSFNGTTATYSAPKFEIHGGAMKDRIDGSATSSKLDVDGGDGDDVIEGGSSRDTIDGDGGLDTIHGNGGNDTIDCGNDSDVGEYEAGWGGPGDDYLARCGINGPGTGDDKIDSNAWIASYADLTQGIEFTQDDPSPSGNITTGGAAGDDVWGSNVYGFVGSQGDDVVLLFGGYIAGDYEGTVRGMGGDDLIKIDDIGNGYVVPTQVFGGAGDDVIVDIDPEDPVVSTFYGNSGNDTLRGGAADDLLYGGPGYDRVYGGTGDSDVCGGEVVDRCELLKRPRTH